MANTGERAMLAMMFDKVQHERRDIDVPFDRLTAALRAIDEIEYAWLFGSRAAGKARADSDIDLAVGLRDGAELDLLGDLHDRILAALDPLVPGERMDLVVLTERTPAALRHQVFKHGKLLFERVRDNLVRLRARTAQQWCDGEPKRRAAWAITRQRIQERA